MLMAMNFHSSDGMAHKNQVTQNAYSFALAYIRTELFIEPTFYERALTAPLNQLATN